MRKLKTLLCLFVLFVIYQNESPAQTNVAGRLRDVKTIYVDETSFGFISSSCMKYYGNVKVVCSKHLTNRIEFLLALKRWMGKYNFVLAPDKASADAVLQGDLAIDDDYATREHLEIMRDRDKKGGKTDPNKSPSIFAPNALPGESVWTVNGWLVNSNGDKLWTSPVGDSPGISYMSGNKSKIEAKKLARKLQYAFEKSK
jgi:hypothetical protein